jgi:hypothetical protein
MSYLYRRKEGLVDLFISKVYRKKVFIRDGGVEGGLFQLVLNGKGFDVVDPNPGVDSASAITTSFETLINNSPVPVTANVLAPGVLELVSDVPRRDFSVSYRTSDPEGSIYHSEAPPESYAIQNASNWDQAFSLMQEVPMGGYASPNVGSDPDPFDAPLNSYSRFRFDPRDYALEDDDVLYLTVTPRIDGTLGDVQPINIILTTEQFGENHTALILRGDAPVAADSDSALEFVLPLQSTSIVVKNEDATNTAFLSLGTGDAEIPIPPGETFRDNKLGTGDLRIRSEGAAATVYLYVTLNNNRIF